MARKRQTKKSQTKKSTTKKGRKTTQARRIALSKRGAVKKGAVPRAKKGGTTARKLNGTAIEWGASAGRRPSARKAYDSNPNARHIAVYGGHRYTLVLDKNGRPFWQK